VSSDGGRRDLVIMGKFMSLKDLLLISERVNFEIILTVHRGFGDKALHRWH
jgi:hypothetical protein